MSLQACCDASSLCRGAAFGSQGPFQQSPKRVTAAPNGERSVGETCVDLHPECAAWASGGECKRNPSYMIGDLGQCRESCNDCPYPTRRFGRKGGSPKN